MMNIGGVPPEEVDEFHEVEYQLAHGELEPESKGSWMAHDVGDMDLGIVNYQLTRRHVELDMGLHDVSDVSKMYLGLVNYLTRQCDGVELDMGSWMALLNISN